jgi:hypothetical protein
MMRRLDHSNVPVTTFIITPASTTVRLESIRYENMRGWRSLGES